MLVFHQKVNPKDVIVGWYSTGLGVTGGSVLINDFYSREVLNPVHLTVDTGFRNGEGTIKAYVSVNLALGDRQLAAQFLLIYAWFSDLDLTSSRQQRSTNCQLSWKEWKSQCKDFWL